MAVASTVTVDFKAQTAKFENGIKKAKKSASGFGSAVGKAMKGAAIGAALLTGATARLVQQSLVLVDTQRKTARTLGTSQRIFAGLSLAAEVSGQSIEAFTKALKRQSKSIIDANDGLQTQARAFKRLGLDTQALLKLPVEKQFGAITTALGKVENSTLKVGIASDIYGAKNSDLINILELGADGIQMYIDKVDALGVALTDRQTKAIEEANDAVLVMKKSFTGLGNQLAARFAPAIKTAAEKVESITQRVTESIPKFVAWASSILGVTRNLNLLTIADLNAEIDQITKDVGDIVDLRDNLGAPFVQTGVVPPGVQAQVDFWNGQIEKLVERADAAKAALAKLTAKGEVNIEPVGEGGNDVSTTGDVAARKFESDFNAATRAVATASEKLQMNIDSIRESLTTNPLWTPELAGRQAQAAVDAYLEEIARIKTEQDALAESQKAAAEAATRAVATPAEELAYRIAEIRAELEGNPYWSPETAQRQSQEAVDAYMEEMQRIASESDDVFKDMSEFQRQAFANMQDILGDFLFDPWADGLTGMLKNFADMLRKMVAQLLASKILEYIGGLFGGSTPLPTPSSGGASFGPPAAIGGIREGGTPLLVGERGPELFTPGATGSIRPVGAVNYESNISIGGGGNGLDVATLIPILEENNRKVKGEILDAFDRGAYA